MDPFEDNLSQMPAVLRYNYTPIQQELENYVNESIEVWCDSKLIKFFTFWYEKKCSSLVYGQINSFTPVSTMAMELLSNVRVAKKWPNLDAPERYFFQK